MLTPTGLNSTKKGYRNFTIWDAVQIALSGQKGWDTTIQNKRVFLRTVFWGCSVLCHFSGPVGCGLKPHLWNFPFTTITQETGSWFGPGKSQLRPEWEGQLLTTETAVRTAEKGWTHYTRVKASVDASTWEAVPTKDLLEVEIEEKNLIVDSEQDKSLQL